MNESSRAGGHRSTNEWRVRLDCGHEVAVPWGSAGPTVMAYVVEHRDHCVPDGAAFPGGEWRTLPFAAAVTAFH